MIEAKECIYRAIDEAREEAMASKLDPNKLLFFADLALAAWPHIRREASTRQAPDTTRAR